MAARASISGARHVKPILSLDRPQAKRRVINLYKAWYRQIPLSLYKYGNPVSCDVARKKLRELFEKNKNLTDIRVIDMLVIKGQMELVETAKMWKQNCHFMNYFKQTYESKPDDFLSKFYTGQP